MPAFDSLPYGLMPLVIVKFVLFDDRHQVYASRWKLNKQMNPLNGKKMYINERLPTMEAKLRQSLSDMGYITSSNNCVVAVKCLKDNGNSTYVPVKNVNEVQALKNPMKQNNSSGIAKQRTNNKRTAQQVSDDERISRLYASLSPDMKKQFLSKNGQGCSTEGYNGF